MYKFIRLILISTVSLAGFSGIILAQMTPWTWVAVAALLSKGLGKKVMRLTAHGTSRWAEYREIRTKNDGLIIGTMAAKPAMNILGLFLPWVRSSAACAGVLAPLQKQVNHLVKLDTIHTACFAPTRVGKGVSFVIPHLLTCTDSMVVIDVKGENAVITAAARLAMGHEVVILNPFRWMMEKPDDPLSRFPLATYNPMDSISVDSPLVIDQARALAAAIVFRTGKESEPHWNDSAQLWIEVMLLMVAVFGEGAGRTLQAVRRLLTDPAMMQEAIAIMCVSNKLQGMLARKGNQLKNYQNKELSSTLTTTNRHMSFLDTLAVSESTKSSSFDPSGLVKGKMTIYLILPADQIRNQAALLRMWIGSFLRAVVMKGGLQEKNKVHFVLDEASSLGHMHEIEEALDQYSGYGVRLRFFYQSVGQLKKCWPDGSDQTLLSNTTQIFFGVNDLDTAKYVSERLGKRTIIVEGWGDNTGTTASEDNQGGGSRGTSGGTNRNRSQVGRELLTPAEVMTLHNRIAITFAPGIPPIWTTLVRYYERGFNQKPGTFWPAIKALALSVAFLIVAALVAATVSGMFQGTPETQAVNEAWFIR